MTALLVLCLSQVSPASGAASSLSLPLTAAPVHSERDEVAQGPLTSGNPSGTSRSETCRSARKGLAFYQRRANEWRAKMGAGTTYPPPIGEMKSCPRYLAALWQRKAFAARKAYEFWFERTYEKYRCLHEHEGAWNSETGNGYHGGLQFDDGFQRTYGPEFMRRWGNASAWPVWAQLIAAERAFYGFSGFSGRGYSPWGTRGMCGL